MSVYWYDKSIVSTLRTITGDDRITVNPTDTLFRFIANLNKDDIKLPLINLHRIGYRLELSTRNTLSSQGLPIGKTPDGRIIDEIQLIPISINYQLDIITRKRDDNDEITDEIIFYLINNPSMEVELKRGINKPHKFSVFISNDVEDNSDIESHMSNGEYFRSTLSLYVPDAKLWKMTRKVGKMLDPLMIIGTDNLDDSSKNYLEEEINIVK